MSRNGRVFKRGDGFTRKCLFEAAKVTECVQPGRTASRDRSLDCGDDRPPSISPTLNANMRPQAATAERTSEPGTQDEPQKINS
ncbi:hypothetical protein [Paracoccus rhizosphaerae]|uniref:Uncharacterized protein n=1 Tax=Paracoccus rhizosphaerae TaxID=1133347 RepID=A0ABV6CEV6_9RHOB